MHYYVQDIETTNTISEFPEESSIWMESAHSNIIRNNILRDDYYGLQLYQSNDNEIEGNVFSYIWRGMMVKELNDNLITNNSFLECTDIELMLDVSNGNVVHHNDFLATTLRVYDVGDDNIWDDGYPSGGNYWSTYHGVDLDGDGIGDTPIEVLPAGNDNYDDYPLMVPANVTFFADKATLSESAGGQIHLYAEAGHGNAFRKYLVVGGLSGTDPGQPLPGGLTKIPVNFDAFTYYVVFPYLNSVLFTDFLGVLDESGRAHPVINAPLVPGFAGNSMYYAFCCNKPFDFASNAIAIDIVP